MSRTEQADRWEPRPDSVPDAVTWIVRTLEKQGYETWTVGGGVRDAVLGHPSADWDFATLARPEQVQRVFRRTVPVGVDHGTVGVLKDGKMFEVTTFRRDIEPLGRRAIVRFADSLDDDLARRDFTLNAVAWHPITRELRDPYGGAQDLRDRVLRAVGTAEERFREDYLRILRGLRFAGRIGLDIDAPTWNAMTQAAAGLKQLSAERVREELVKVLSSTPRASATLALYDASGALAQILPELGGAREHAETWRSTLLTVDAIRTSDPVLRVAALLAPVARAQGVGTVLGALKRLRFSNADSAWIAGCIAPPWDLPAVDSTGVGARQWAAAAKPAHRRPRLRLALARARSQSLIHGVDPARVLRAVRSIRAEIQAGHPLALSALAIDGKDLIRMGVQPGPQVGELLDTLLGEVVKSPEANTVESLLERAQSLRERP